MKITKSECVDCGKPCIHEACPNYSVTRYYCDKCKQEFEPEALYVTDNGDLCDKCILNEYQTVAQEEELQ